jgi:hypothetical protein
LIEERQISPPLSRGKTGIDLTDSGLVALGDNGMVRERRLKPGCSGSYVSAAGIGSTNKRPGVLCRAPPSLFSTLGIPGNAETAVTPAADAYEIEGADIVARTM